MVAAARRTAPAGTSATRSSRNANRRRTERSAACVEGWSTTQAWTGVRLHDLAELVGADPEHVLHVRSLQAAGLEVTGVKDVTPQAHNGCRPRKRRRV